MIVINPEPVEVLEPTEFGTFKFLLSRTPIIGHKTVDRVTVCLLDSDTNVVLPNVNWKTGATLKAVELIKKYMGATFLLMRHGDYLWFGEMTYPNNLRPTIKPSLSSNINLSNEIDKLTNFILAQNISATALAIVAERRITNTKGE